MKKLLGCFLCVMLLVFGVSISGVQATLIDIYSGDVTIGDAIFGAVTDAKAGRGVYPTFLATQGDAGNDPGINLGYNSDYRPVQFNETTSAQHNHSLAFTNMGTVDIGGILYYSFALDADQAPGSDPFLYMDTFQVFQTNDPNITGYSTGTGSFGSSADLVYDMDVAYVLGDGNAVIKVDYLWGGKGSGWNDMIVDIRADAFDPTSYSNVVLFAGFYGDNDGPQEWSYLAGQSVPEPATMLLFGSGILGLGLFGRKKFKV